MPAPTPSDALTDEEKEKCRYHLGYLEVASAASVQLGIPKALPTVFLLEQGLEQLINGYAVNRVRCILQILDDLEAKLVCGAQALAAESIGNLKLHPLAGQGKLYTDSLEGEYRRWACRLADILGVPLYPYSKRFRKTGPGSVVPVS